MKSLAKRVGSVLLAGFVVHGAMVACSGGESSSTAQAGTGGSSSGGGSCTCAPPTVITIHAADFVQFPATSTDPTWMAVLKIPGRTGESMMGAMAYGVPSNTNTDPLINDDDVRYVALNVVYRDDSISVPTGKYASAGKEPQAYLSVRFVIPPAP